MSWLCQMKNYADLFFTIKIYKSEYRVALQWIIIVTGGLTVNYYCYRSSSLCPRRLGITWNSGMSLRSLVIWRSLSVLVTILMITAIVSVIITTPVVMSAIVVMSATVPLTIAVLTLIITWVVLSVSLVAVMVSVFLRMVSVPIISPEWSTSFATTPSTSTTSSSSPGRWPGLNYWWRRQHYRADLEIGVRIRIPVREHRAVVNIFTHT